MNSAGEKTGQLSPSDTGGTRWACRGWTATSAAATGAAATRRSGLSVVEVRGFLIRCGMGRFNVYLYSVYTACTPVNKYDAVCLYWWLRKIRQKKIVDYDYWQNKTSTSSLVLGIFLKTSKYGKHWGQWRFELRTLRKKGKLPLYFDCLLGIPKKGSQQKCQINLYTYLIIWTTKDIRKDMSDMYMSTVCALMVCLPACLFIFLDEFSKKTCAFGCIWSPSQTNLAFPKNPWFSKFEIFPSKPFRYWCWSRRSRRTRRRTTACGSTGKTRWWWACRWGTSKGSR